MTYKARQDTHNEELVLVVKRPSVFLYNEYSMTSQMDFSEAEGHVIFNFSSSGIHWEGNWQFTSLEYFCKCFLLFFVQ